ncbi:MAG: cytochrome c-type biogenesis protein CcmH [Desulfobacterales bacterium]
MNLKYSPKTASIFVIIMALSLIPAVHVFALTAGEITQSLTCTCGCNMLVSACEGSMECTPAKEITDQVTQMIETGQSKEDIIQYFVSTKGERILAAPTKKGFNLTAWILPFLAIILGAGGIYIFIDKCLAPRENTDDESENSDKKQVHEGKYLALFEKELKDFEL